MDETRAALADGFKDNSLTNSKQYNEAVMANQTSKLRPVNTPYKQYPPGVKVFNCSLCPYTTVYKSDLKRHNLQHTGERPYKCYVCNKDFTQNHVLKTHMLIHLRQKPFQCEVCQQSFRHAKSLNDHKHKLMHYPSE
ncbi:hypothetical protein JTE90_009457 [Oedothorax gibbosus]|uniref:C2H2-type domain-containing protein n=1 Tax=Oedothorax gibbosus TaxID=931172 RepID=A0AAV6VV14_9ARAC|nr:hypothetical protein JTE90_009457 [Oedothorax gibbosus]